MKKALPILSMISAFCCALGLLVEIFPIIVDYDLMLESLIAYLGGIIACITMVLWLITGKGKQRKIALVSIILEAALVIVFAFFMPLNSITIHNIVLNGLVVVPMIANILFVYYSE